MKSCMWCGKDEADHHKETRACVIGPSKRLQLTTYKECDHRQGWKEIKKPAAHERCNVCGTVRVKVYKKETP